MAAWNFVVGAKVTVVVGQTLDDAVKLASKYGVEGSENLDKVLRRDDIDAVDICTPTYLHRQHVEYAAEYGKHILLETPPMVASMPVGAWLYQLEVSPIDHYLHRLLVITPAIGYQ